jgi:hypothetical protein
LHETANKDNEGWVMRIQANPCQSRRIGRRRGAGILSKAASIVAPGRVRFSLYVIETLQTSGRLSLPGFKDPTTGLTTPPSDHIPLGGVVRFNGPFCPEELAPLQAQQG